MRWWPIIRCAVSARLRYTEGWQELSTPEKTALLAFLASEYVLLVAMPLAFLTALAASRLGAYLLLAALALHILGRQLALLVFAAHQDEVKVTASERRASLTGVACLAVLVFGLLAAVAGWKPGAGLAVAGLLGHLAGHLVTGCLTYRRVMAQPWPDVSPVEDDDW